MTRRRPEHRTGLSLLILGTCMSVLAACSGDQIVRPTEGAILVSTTTTGADVDPDGYSVAIDNLPEQTVGITDMLTVPNLEPGDHNVTLTGVTENCNLGGSGNRIVNVIPGDTVTVRFVISCEAISPLPPPGGPPQP
jgi:hypothetical protein